MNRSECNILIFTWSMKMTLCVWNVSSSVTDWSTSLLSLLTTGCPRWAWPLWRWWSQRYKRWPWSSRRARSAWCPSKLHSLNICLFNNLDVRAQFRPHIIFSGVVKNLWIFLLTSMYFWYFTMCGLPDIVWYCTIVMDISPPKKYNVSFLIQ